MSIFDKLGTYVPPVMVNLPRPSARVISAMNRFNELMKIAETANYERQKTRLVDALLQEVCNREMAAYWQCRERLASLEQMPKMLKTASYLENQRRQGLINGLKRHYKTASTAHLSRAISALLKKNKGKPVPSKMIESLVKKTQSTAERQARYYDSNLPPLKGQGWSTAFDDTGTWGRTGLSTAGLARNESKAKDCIKDMQEHIKQIDKIKHTTWWEQFRYLLSEHKFPTTVRDQLQKALPEAQIYQEELRKRGRAIGQMQGKIRPANSTTTPHFDAMDSIQPESKGIKGTVNLSDAVTPLAQSMKDTAKIIGAQGKDIASKEMPNLTRWLSTPSVISSHIRTP